MTASGVFAYKGRTAVGKIVTGRLDAASENAAMQRLRGMGLAPISVAEVNVGTGLKREVRIPGLSNGVGLKDLAVMS